MVLVKKCQFLHSFIVGQISQENVFHDILERKNAFLGYETRSLKNRKMGVFPKGLVHGFRLKVSNFHPFVLGKKGQENVFYDILERKNKKVKKSKIFNFSKEVSPWFW